jgi:hypothetical protein
MGFYAALLLILNMKVLVEYCNGNVLAPSYIAFTVTFSYNKFVDLPQGKCYLIVFMGNGSIINYRMVGKHLLLIYIFFREVGFHF